MTFQRSKATPLIRPPLAGTFTLRQTGTNAALVDSPDGLLFTATSRAVGEDSILADVAIPGGAGGAYTMTVGFIPVFGESGASAGFFNYSIAGIALYEVATTKVADLTLYGDATGAMHNQFATKTGLTATGSAAFDLGGYPMLAGPQIWFRVQDDGLVAGASNRTWSYSNDGVNFVKMKIEGRATNFTTAPDRLCLYLNAFNANAKMLVNSFSLVGVALG